MTSAAGTVNSATPRGSSCGTPRVPIVTRGVTRGGDDPVAAHGFSVRTRTASRKRHVERPHTGDLSGSLDPDPPRRRAPTADAGSLLPSATEDPFADARRMSAQLRDAASAQQVDDRHNPCGVHQDDGGRPQSLRASNVGPLPLSEIDERSNLQSCFEGAPEQNRLPKAGIKVAPSRLGHNTILRRTGSRGKDSALRCCNGWCPADERLAGARGSDRAMFSSNLDAHSGIALR